jgi:hypothetical protein
VDPNDSASAAFLNEQQKIENKYLKKLKTFEDVFFFPIEEQEGATLRDFREEPPVEKIFHLFHRIREQSELFMRLFKDGVETCGKAEGDMSMVVMAYSRLEELFKHYANYADGFADTLNCVRMHTSEILSFTNKDSKTKNLPVEGILMLPLEHYVTYAHCLEKLYKRVSKSHDGALQSKAAIKDVLKKVSAWSKGVKDVLETKEEYKLELLRFQAEFADQIYIPRRRFIATGKVSIPKKNVQVSKKYSCHLFNDAIILSQHQRQGVLLVIKKTLILSSCVVSQQDDDRATFRVGISGGANVKKEEILLTCSSPEECKGWVDAVDKAVAKANKNRRSSLRMDMSVADMAKMAINSSDLDKANMGALMVPSDKVVFASPMIPGLPDTGADARCQALGEFFSLTASRFNEVAVLYFIGLQPLERIEIDPKLFVGHFDGTAQSIQVMLTTAEMKDVRKSVATDELDLFVEAVSKALSHLRATVGLMAKTVTKDGWDGKLLIGRTLSGAMGQEPLQLVAQLETICLRRSTVMRSFRGAGLSKFSAEVDHIIAGDWGNMENLIVSMAKIPLSITSFLATLLAATPDSHPDKHDISKVHGMWKGSVDKVADALRLRQNHDKLMDIKVSLKSKGILKSEPVIDTLVTADRIFLLEGDLKKVCRKANKTFHFWLFNDLLMYGAPSGQSQYQFHRAFELKYTQVRVKEDVPNAFEISGKEKSFIVIAPNNDDMKNWVGKIQEELSKMETAGTAAPKETLAPVWVPDQEASTCKECDCTFTFIRRRHHCRRCGGLTCGNHSKRRMIIMSVHPKEKQRVCDSCYEARLSGEDDEFDLAGASNGPRASTAAAAAAEAAAPTSPVRVDYTKEAPEPAMPPPPMPAQQTHTAPPPPMPQRVAAAPPPPLPSKSVNAPPAMQMRRTAAPPPPKRVVKTVVTAAAAPAATDAAAAASPPPPPPPPPPGPPIAQAAAAPPPPPPGPPAAAGNPAMAKYVKMLSMLPEGAVRQKMMMDGISSAEQDAFFASQPGGGGGAPPPPPGPPRGGSAPPPPGPPRGGSAPPPPPSGGGGGGGPVAAHMVKYDKMLSMLPEGAVRQKMQMDGIAQADQLAFFAAKGIVSEDEPAPKWEGRKRAPAPPPSGGSTSAAGGGGPVDMMAAIKAGIKLKPRGAGGGGGNAPPPPLPNAGPMDMMSAIKAGIKLKPAGAGGGGGAGRAPPPPAAPGPMDMMSAIKAGIKLKPAAPKAAPPPKAPTFLDNIKGGVTLKKSNEAEHTLKPAPVAQGGLFGALADAMSDRRNAFANDDSSDNSGSSGSDSGFSDSDSD